MSKTTDEKPKDEPVKWVKLTNEHGNIMEVPPQHVADNVEDKNIPAVKDESGKIIIPAKTVKAVWKIYKAED